MKSVHYGCTALLGTNKAGLLKPDEFGRYDIVLGALEYPNSVGDIYTLTSAQKFFEEGTSLRRKINNGQLRSEYGHPKQLPGQSPTDYMRRILTIEETLVCAHISDVWIDFNSVRDKTTGRPIITIRGKVKPAGPYGKYLQEMLDDPKQNVAFSVRSLTMNRTVGFRQHKDFTEIVTWDYVNEPGLAPANKYDSPALEGMNYLALGQTELEITSALVQQFKEESISGLSFESAETIRTLESAMFQAERSARYDW